MEYLLLFFIMLNNATFLSNVFNEKIEKTLFLGIVFDIIILFVFGLFSVMNIGFVCLLILNIIEFIFNIYYLVTKKSRLKENVLTIGLILFIFSFIFLLWQSHGRMVKDWDEFSHWALAVKNMYGLNSIKLGGKSTIIFDYLSGTAIFQYFCVKISGAFNESMLYMGQWLIIVSLILPIVSIFKRWKNILIYLLYGILFLLPTLFFPTIYTSLYVDGVLALAFAYAVYSYFMNNDNSSKVFNYINLVASFIMLVFIKAFGFYLALGVYAIVLIDVLFVKNKFRLQGLWKNYKWIILSIVPAILIKLTWSVALNIWNFKEVWNTGSIKETIINILMLNLKPYQLDTISNFSDALYNTNLTASNFNITFFVIVGISIALSYFLINKLKGKEKQRVKVMSTLLILGIFVYAFMILLAYLSVFSEYEATTLASYSRYLGTYMLGITLVLIMVHVIVSNAKEKDNGKFIIGLLLVFSCIYTFEPLIYMTIHARSGVAYSQLRREPFKELKIIRENILDKNDKLYFICTNSNGQEFYASRYEITPNKMNEGAWSIGEKYNNEDLWTVNKSLESWKDELLSGYDYVYLFNVDEEFINRYGGLFMNQNIEDKQLYKVVNNNDGKILKLVDY